jgi:transcriptional regulator with XRE-family HTH domain
MDQTPPFGPRLRALRRAKGLSLSDLAAQTGVSEATLSRIETGLTQVSAPHLYGLAAQLGVDISSFCRGPARRGTRAITRADAGEAFDSPRLSARLLAGDLPHKSMHPFMNRVTATTLAQVGGLGAHDGEEFLLVLTGSLVLHSGAHEPLILAPGDSLYFDASEPHAYLALNDPVAFLVVSSAPQPQGAPDES